MITDGVELLSLARFFQYFGNILNFLEKFPIFSLLVPWSTVMAEIFCSVVIAKNKQLAFSFQGQVSGRGKMVFQSLNRENCYLLSRLQNSCSL